jgi:RNA polymerase sigma-70 factor (ECF subfamily)
MHGIIDARLGTDREPIVHNDDERRLIEHAKQGDLTALGTLYNLHVDRIYQYALYRTGDDQTAEDIAAEVFLRAIESIGNYEDQGVPFAAWLYRIAHARVVDFWRSSKRHQTAPLEDPLLQEELTSQDDGIDIDFLQHRLLATALRQLTDDQQNVIVLKFRQGLSNAEIAQVLGKTEGAVKALQWRALEALARILNK